MSTNAILEVCVDSPDGLTAAISGGADRIELCSALELGGLTPSAGMLSFAKRSNAECHVMIRPRSGDFVLRAGDLDAMLSDIDAVQRAELHGVVVGVAKQDHTLDIPTLEALSEAASGLDVTLHRVFDMCPDPFVAVDQAIDLGFKRILTSGQEKSAEDGVDLIAKLVKHGAGRIEIMAGSGVDVSNAGVLLATGIDALHASCSAREHLQTDCNRIGICERRITLPDKVAALKGVMTERALCA